ncbi:uncharacterized protein F5147DRAFT_747619 [Suillus discolor]|uniref:Ubiquitin-like protease family profile domain-containing protein n=1 Tax=Suillus discolor TaxID=1912936 RepID=A0A9P7EX00_9AGAM|nr:uncharacterized protein F5147DRAFT_747619 [Suillus discolor]KAG2096052.1 hypothetical protein F5147DRAFT_747619 [Suillus discolor]
MSVKWRILPDQPTNSLYKNWIALIPTLVDPVLQYFGQMQGKALENIRPVISACGSLCVLIHHGLFPTAPSQPQMAVSVDLLSFYCTLFEHSCDAINALASALKNYYSWWGYQMTDAQGKVIQDPFRRGPGYAIQWYDILQVEVERQVEMVVQQHFQNSPSLTQCTPLLVQRCPACFAGILHGRSTDEGGDIHVAMDGNFHHCHRCAAGDCPNFYDPTYFLPKSFVDAIGHHIDTQCKRPVKSHVPLVPNEAIDQCKNAYEAADGKKQKAAMDSFDDTGIMALICCHDIPLFFANIDSPGEQQKYSVALLHHFFSFLLPEATVIALYDIGCVLARTLSKYDILPISITSHLRFATTAMHAYGHKWACQLIYNPQICVGLGLSDGEGTERLWSCLVQLIGVEHTSSRQHCLWLIDRQAVAIASEMRIDLGDWIKRRLRRGIKEQGSAAQDALDRCGVPIEELQSEWLQQRHSQLSIRAHAPARLKKELDTVLALQADLDTSDKALQTARTMLEKDMASDDTPEALESLERGHDRLMNKVEALYSSLNVHDRFPELHGINLEFVRILLMARDLKMNVHKHAIASFFEWDKLDRAVGGIQQVLGTKLHQQTCKAISKCQPALMTAIRRFNSYCERLNSLYDTSWGIPLPAPLPTKLAELCSDPGLMEDVWITPSLGEVPRWLDDTSIRDGIRALLKHDRCREEQVQLGVSLSQFHCSNGMPNFIRLQTRWSNCLASSVRFTNKVSKAVAIATTLSGGSPNMMFHWINASTLVVPDSVGSDELPIVDPDHCPQGEMGALELDDNDSTNYGCKVNAMICWNLPDVQPDILDPAKNFARIRPSHDGIPRLLFEPKDIGILSSPTACLNDICINNCAILLWCSQLNTSTTHYWEKDIWLSTKELYLFDSMGDRMPWQSDVKHIIRLIARFIAIARQHGHHVHIDLEGWVARPLNIKCLQNNDFDCGLWILAAIFAVVRGSHITGLHERDMDNLRWLYADYDSCITSSLKLQ